MSVTPITQIDALAARLAKARALVGQVSPADAECYDVASGDDKHYLVNGQCNCPDARFRRELHKGYCKHRLAVYLYRESRDERAEHEKGTKEKTHG